MVQHGAEPADRAGAAADRARRHARPQHARTPADQARRHRGPSTTPSSPTPLALFGIPDDAAERLRYAISIPHLGSLILTHTWNGEVQGLKEWPREDRPPVWPVFFGFRIMVGHRPADAGDRRHRLGPAAARSACSRPDGSCGCASGRRRSASSR